MSKSKTTVDEGYIPEEKADFDFKKIHEFDPRTRELVRLNPIRVIKDNGVTFVEWPKGSGNLWWEDKTFAGAMDEKGKPVRGKKHSKWEPPLTMDQKVAMQNMVLEKENKRLALEVAQMRKEKELTATHPKVNVTSGSKEAAEVKANS